MTELPPPPLCAFWGRGRKEEPDPLPVLGEPGNGDSLHFFEKIGSIPTYTTAAVSIEIPSATFVALIFPFHLSP